MSPGARKVALTTHVTFSVGWLGAVAVSLALAIAGLMSDDSRIVRSAYLSMRLIGWWILVPLSFASLSSGLVQALGTHWGLFRHYWVIVKLLMNIFATSVLLLYMQTLTYLADAVAAAGRSDADLLSLRSPSPVLHSAGALLLLLMATVLSVFKPRGMTRYGWRREAVTR